MTRYVMFQSGRKMAIYRVTPNTEWDFLLWLDAFEPREGLGL